MSANKQLTVLQRLESVENSVKSNEEVIGNLFNQVRTGLQSHFDVMESLLEVLKETFPDLDKKLQDAMVAKKNERDAARVEQERAQLEKLVEGGVLKLTEKITERSVIVGRIFNSENEVQSPGRLQVDFGRLNPVTREALRDQAVGFIFEAPNKDRFEVLEIYEVQDALDQAAPAAEVPTAPAPQPEQPSPAPAS